MDYAEGLFLGTYWSDTDFENRRHTELFALYGILTTMILLLVYWSGRTFMGIGIFSTADKVVLIGLSVLNPLLCFSYYRMPLWGRICVLLVKLYKAYLVMNLTVCLILPRITVKTGGIKDFIVDYLNSTLETYTERFAAGGGSFSTVMGVLAGGIHVVLTAALIIVALVVIPGLAVIVFKAAQYIYDFIIDRLILRRVFKYKR